MLQLLFDLFHHYLFFFPMEWNEAKYLAEDGNEPSPAESLLEEYRLEVLPLYPPPLLNTKPRGTELFNWRTTMVNSLSALSCIARMHTFLSVQTDPERRLLVYSTGPNSTSICDLFHLENTISTRWNKNFHVLTKKKTSLHKIVLLLNVSSTIAAFNMNS